MYNYINVNYKDKAFVHKDYKIVAVLCSCMQSDLSVYYPWFPQASEGLNLKHCFWFPWETGSDVFKPSRSCGYFMLPPQAEEHLLDLNGVHFWLYLYGYR